MTIESVARYILLSCYIKEIEITPLKLQKLLYYVQSWHLVYFDGENIYNNDIVPEAWQNGPVYPTIYGKYYHNNGISKNDLIVIEGDYDILNEEFGSLKNDLGDKCELVEVVITKYANLPAYELVMLTHAELPWSNANAKCKTFRCKEKLSLKDMQDYYSGLLEKRRELAHA